MSSSTATKTASTTTTRTTTNNATTTTKAPPTTHNDKHRYEHLQELVDNGLRRSINALDCATLVQDTYGDEYNNNKNDETLVMLNGVMESMLEKVCHTVKEQLVPPSGSSNDQKSSSTASFLAPLDEVIRHVQHWQTVQDQWEDFDQRRTKTALDHSLLPPGVSVEDVMRHEQYQTLMQEKSRLQESLKEVDQTVQELQEEQLAPTQKTVQQQLASLSNVAQHLQSSADMMCSTTVMGEA